MSFLAAMVLALPHAAHAQSAPQRALPPAEQRERNREDSDTQNRAQERERALRRQQEHTRDELKPAGPTAKAAKLVDEAPCVLIRQVGLNVIPGDPSTVSDWAWVLKALDGPDHDDSPLRRCIGTAGIDLLTRRVQDAVVARGFTTTAVLLERQDLQASQALTFTIVPGRVHAIRFAEPVSLRGNARNALPIKPGDILNLRDLEQAIEIFRRVPSARAEIEVGPVQGVPGRSDLIVKYEQGMPFRLSLSTDDSGTKSTGKYQGSVTFSYDNWWTLNDLFYVTVNHDLGGGNEGDRGTRGGVVHYSVPFDYWLFSATGSRSTYHQHVAGLSQTYTYRGTSDNAEVKLSRLVYRDASRKTTFGFKGWQRKSNNFIDDLEIDVQRRVVGGWTFDINHKEFVSDAILEGTLAYKRGTGAFGSLPAPEELFGEGTSRFALITADVSLNVPFKIAGQKLNYNGTLHWQLNRTLLTPQEQLTLGGRYSIRGTDGESALAGERGVYVRNEVSAPLGESGQNVYVALDYGRVGGPSAEFLVSKSLAGIALGVRGTVKGAQYDFFIGSPLKKPDTFQTSRMTAGFSLNYSF